MFFVPTGLVLGVWASWRQRQILGGKFGWHHHQWRQRLDYDAPMATTDREFCIGEAKEFRAIAKSLQLQVEYGCASIEAQQAAQQLMGDLKEKLKYYHFMENARAVLETKSQAMQAFCRMINKAGSQLTSKADSNPHDERWDSQVYAFLIDVDYYLSYMS